MCSARTADRRLDALGAWGFTLATIVSFGSLLVLAAWSWAAAVVDTQQLMSPATAIVLGLLGAGFALLHLRLRFAAAAAFIAALAIVALLLAAALGQAPITAAAVLAVPAVTDPAGGVTVATVLLGGITAGAGLLATTWSLPRLRVSLLALILLAAMADIYLIVLQAEGFVSLPIDVALSPVAPVMIVLLAISKGLAHLRERDLPPRAKTASVRILLAATTLSLVPIVALGLGEALSTTGLDRPVAFGLALLGLAAVLVAFGQRGLWRALEQLRWVDAAQAGANGIVVIRPDGTIVYANDRLTDLLGWTPGDLVGRSADVLVGGDLARVHQQLAADYLLDPHPLVQDRVLARHQDGSLVRVRVTLTPHTHTGHRVVVAAFEDQRRLAAAEAAQRSSERLFRRAMSDAASGMCLLNPNTLAITEANASLAQMLGRDVTDLIGCDLREFHDRGDVPRLQGDLDRMLAGRQDTFRITVRLVRPDGAQRIAELSVGLIRDDHGIATHLVAQVLDMTARARTEQALARSELHYRLLANHMSDIVARTDATGEISWVSASVRRATGRPSESFVGYRLPQLVDPRDHDRAVDLHERAQRTGAAAHERLRLLVYDDGPRWFAVTASPIPGDADNPAGAVLTLHDVDGQVASFRALRASEERFRMAMASAPGGMAVLGLDGSFIEVNDALGAMVQRSRDWLLRHCVAHVVFADDRGLAESIRAYGAAGGDSEPAELRLLTAAGDPVWVQLAIGLVRDVHGDPMNFVCQFVDVTEIRRARLELESLANQDSLTRVGNRRALTRRLERTQRHRRRGDGLVGVLYLDLDGLKPINDRLGHAAGDDLIIAVAGRIGSVVRHEDFVARLGGDEFVVLLTDLSSEPDLMRIAEKVRTAIAEPVVVDRQEVRTTVSVGAVIARRGEHPDTVLANADEALYRAKHGGRNKVVLFHPDAVATPSGDGEADAAAPGAQPPAGPVAGPAFVDLRSTGVVG